MIEKLTHRFKRWHQYINGSTIHYNLNDYYQKLSKIKKVRQTYKSESDRQLKEYYRNFAGKVRKEKDLDALMIEIYALVGEVIYRVLQFNPFDVQIIGAIVLHEGKLAEMQTGEGKTLTAVFPAVLNALTRRGVHILTFNDYLARRDAQWMGPLYQFLNLSAEFVQEGMDAGRRRKAYCADITYLSAKEAGFDFLRDSLCSRASERVQRERNFALIDEADSILIDEARIPLVIAGACDSRNANSAQMSAIAKQLIPKRDVEIDEGARNAYLTDSGLKRIEKMLNCKNLHASENIDLMTRLNCAVHAEFLLLRDVDYVVRNNTIEIVDEFTGRIADKRRWPDGLQAALEAKENIDAASRGQILNAITLQHYIQHYPKKSGMTATAQAAAEEFDLFYDLEIVVIPPNRTCKRVDHKDRIFKTRKEKDKALVQEIMITAQTKRPVLVGTRCVEESEALAVILKENNIKCNVLNAKQDEDEAEIIARAGNLGAVTISTNMAGRGTDICLGNGNPKEKENIESLGGLYVIGTHRHDSERIDKQLRGRAGRQGDPGSSRFFISLEDDIFTKYRLRDSLPENLEWAVTGEIDNQIVRDKINRIQALIEGQHLEIKQTLCKYAAIIEKQRELICEERLYFMSPRNAYSFFQSASPHKFNTYQALLSHEKLDYLCRRILISLIDRYWSQYLTEIGEVREEIHLHSIGGKDPYLEFQKAAAQIFADLSKEIRHQAIETFMAMPLNANEIDMEMDKIKTPSATWTYTINDNPMGLMLGIVNDIGKMTAGGITAPILALISKLRSARNRK